MTRIYSGNQKIGISVKSNIDSFGSVIVALILVQIIFYQFQYSQATSQQKSIESIFRDHEISSNAYSLSQSLTDLESIGLIKCTKLSVISGDQKEQIFLDLRFKNLCDQSSHLAIGAPPARSTRLV